MTELTDELTTEESGRGRPKVDKSHPLGFLRNLAARLGPGPLDPDELLDFAVTETTGFAVTYEHPVLEYGRMRRERLRNYAATACAEARAHRDEDGKIVAPHVAWVEDESESWKYDDPDDAPLDSLFEHLRTRKVTDRGRKQSAAELRQIAEERAVAAGSTFEAEMAKAESRWNDRHDTVGVEAE